MRMEQGLPSGMPPGMGTQGQGMTDGLGGTSALLPMPPGLPMPGMMAALMGGDSAGHRQPAGMLYRGGQQVGLLLWGCLVSGTEICVLRCGAVLLCEIVLGLPCVRN